MNHTNLKIILLILISNTVLGQKPTKSDGYQSDFDYLMQKLIETHPDPYLGFGGSIEFFRKRTQTSKLITDSTTKEDFVILLNQFLSNLDDGHTLVYFPKDSSQIIKTFPLKFKISVDKIFVQNSTEEYIQLIGNQLIAINETPIPDLLVKVTTFEPSENISGKYDNLSKIISKSNLAQRFFGTTQLTLTFRSRQGDILSFEIPFQQQAKFAPDKSVIEFENNNDLLYWSMLGKHKDIGYLAWNSILSREVVENIYQNSPDWVQGSLNWAYHYLPEKQTGNIEQDIQNIPSLYEVFYHLSKMMTEKNSNYLIIDLRKNRGGMTPIIKPLLYILYGDNYLNFDFDAEMIRKISPLYLQKIGFSDIKSFNQAYNCNFKIGDYIFSSFGNFDHETSLEQKKQMVQNGYNGFGTKFIKATKLPTDIQVFILTSPQTFSAAYHFTYFLKKLGRTQIIGVASKQAGNSFMETTNFTLPHTKISGSISNSRQVLFKHNPKLGKILQPDYQMKWHHFKKYEFDKNAEILKAIEIIENK